VEEKSVVVQQKQFCFEERERDEKREEEEKRTDDRRAVVAHRAHDDDEREKERELDALKKALNNEGKKEGEFCAIFYSTKDDLFEGGVFERRRRRRFWRTTPLCALVFWSQSWGRFLGVARRARNNKVVVCDDDAVRRDDVICVVGKH